MKRRSVSWLLALAVVLAPLLLFGAAGVGAAAPSIAVTPSPIVIALTGAPRANPAVLVPVTFSASGFVPNGRVFFYMSGSFRAVQTTCYVTTSPASCFVSPSPVGPGNYSVRVRYVPSVAGAGPLLAIDVPVLVTP